MENSLENVAPYGWRRTVLGEEKRRFRRQAGPCKTEPRIRKPLFGILKSCYVMKLLSIKIVQAPLRRMNPKGSRVEAWKLIRKIL